jgi:hypothetical protein
MDIKELLKYQMIGQMGVGSLGARRAGGSADGNLWGVVLQLFFMLFMAMIDDIAKVIPKLATEYRVYFSGKLQENIQKIGGIGEQLSETSIPLSTRHAVNTLVISRVFIKDDSSLSGSSGGSGNSGVPSDEANGMADAILSKISRLNNVPSFMLIGNGSIMIDYKDKPIQLTNDIYVKIDSIVLAPSGAVSSVKMLLLSNTVSAAEISAYVKIVYNNYLQDMKNSLGDHIFFFDQKSKDTQPPRLPANGVDALNHKRMLINTAPKNLQFTMTPFYSNKKFSNICGEQVRLIEKRVRFFMDNRNWYDSKGIPYQLGLLMSGVPGAGKTSAIRAIANMTRRHIINVNFANITTASQLKNLFYSERINVYTDSSMSQSMSYFIPIEQRLYVLEEIDAIGDIVKQRTSEDCGGEVVNDELTLMEILTVLDGTMEIPGRIVIMTTNHPEMLDRALIRPGRIDVQVKFGYAEAALIAEMYESYFDTKLPVEYLKLLPDRQLSPAEVGQVLFRHFNDSEDHRAIVYDLMQTASMKSGEPYKQMSEMPEMSEMSEIAVCEQDEMKLVPTAAQLESTYREEKSNDGQSTTTRVAIDSRKTRREFYEERVKNASNEEERRFHEVALEKVIALDALAQLESNDAGDPPKEWNTDLGIDHNGSLDCLDCLSYLGGCVDGAKARLAKDIPMPREKTLPSEVELSSFYSQNVVDGSTIDEYFKTIAPPQINLTQINPTPSIIKDYLKKRNNPSDSTLIQL